MKIAQLLTILLLCIHSIFSLRCKCTTSKGAAACSAEYCDVHNTNEKRAACGAVRVDHQTHFACVLIKKESNDTYCHVVRSATACWCRGLDFCNVDLESELFDVTEEDGISIEGSDDNEEHFVIEPADFDDGMNDFNRMHNSHGKLELPGTASASGNQRKTATLLDMHRVMQLTTLPKPSKTILAAAEQFDDNFDLHEEYSIAVRKQPANAREIIQDIISFDKPVTSITTETTKQFPSDTQKSKKKFHEEKEIMNNSIAQSKVKVTDENLDEEIEKADKVISIFTTLPSFTTLSNTLTSTRLTIIIPTTTTTVIPTTTATTADQIDQLIQNTVIKLAINESRLKSDLDSSEELNMIPTGSQTNSVIEEPDDIGGPPRGRIIPPSLLDLESSEKLNMTPTGSQTNSVIKEPNETDGPPRGRIIPPSLLDLESSEELNMTPTGSQTNSAIEEPNETDGPPREGVIPSSLLQPSPTIIYSQLSPIPFFDKRNRHIYLNKHSNRNSSSLFKVVTFFFIINIIIG